MNDIIVRRNGRPLSAGPFGVGVPAPPVERRPAPPVRRPAPPARARHDAILARVWRPEWGTRPPPGFGAARWRPEWGTRPAWFGARQWRREWGAQPAWWGAHLAVAEQDDDSYDDADSSVAPTAPSPAAAASPNAPTAPDGAGPAAATAPPVTEKPRGLSTLAKVGIGAGIVVVVGAIAAIVKR
jgi:hypothetical protein